MSNYLHLFETQAAHDAVYNGSQYTEPWVGLVTANDSISYNNPEYKLRSTPLTFEIISDGNITWKTYSSSFIKTIEYKKNNGNWTSITPTTNGATISVVSGDTVQFRGDNTTYGDFYATNYCYFNGTTAGFKLKGNIMSLISSTNFATLTTLESLGTFTYLFYNCTGLTDARDLVLPATTLSQACYQYMFYSCSNLINTPKLSATTLVNKCYSHMFYNCTSLNNVICLATNIAPAITDYTYMWLDNVSSTGTFTKAASISSWSSGASGIPSGWTVQDAS